MKKKLLFVLLILLVHASTYAVVDPEPNRMSIYFDTNADTWTVWTTQFSIVPFHIILTNPDFAALYGYEFGFDVDGNATIMSVTLYGDGIIDVGGNPTNHIIGLSGPMPTAPATVLATVQVFLLDPLPTYLTLEAAQPSSVYTNTPAVLLANDEILPIRPSAWDTSAGAPLVCAMINDGEFAVDEATWDQVKALYR